MSLSKKPRKEDQAAIDMITIGTFLSVSCATYQALLALGDLANQGKDAADAAAAQSNAIWNTVKGGLFLPMDITAPSISLAKNYPLQSASVVAPAPTLVYRALKGGGIIGK